MAFPSESLFEPLPPPAPADAEPPGRGRLARLGAWLAPRAHLVFPLTACAVVLFATAHIWPGAVQTGDALYHFGNAYDVAEAIRNGQDPLGRLPQIFGTPVLRFYQPLHALAVGAIVAWTDLPLELVFSFFVIVPFALSPFAYQYLLRGLGFDRWAAAFGSFVSLTTVLGFSNSFLGLFSGGIVTQAPAALFFPFFLGKFVRLLHGETGFVGAGVFFALTTLSHAAFAVYAVISAALAAIVLWPRSLRAVGGAAAAGALALLLAAFWIVPFLSYHGEHRPVPDAVARSDQKMWFNGLAGRELGQLIATGRFFDGERDIERGPDDHLDTRMRSLNIFGLHTLRPPVLSFVMLLGSVVALIRLRRPGVRFLLCLAATGFLLVLGHDDVRAIGRMPFMGQMQGFRATYLLDQGALGIAALGLYEVARLFIRLGRLGSKLPKLPRRVAAGVGVLVVVGVCGVTIGWLLAHAAEITKPGGSGWVKTFDRNLGPNRERIGPYRIRGKYAPGTNQNRRNNLIHRLGFPVPCSHTAGITGQTGRAACQRLTGVSAWPIGELMGVGYWIVDRRYPHGLADVTLPDGRGRFRRLSNKRNMQLWESRGRAYVHLAPGPLVLVQSTHAQWVQLIEGWLLRYGSRVREVETPTFVRVSPEELGKERLLRKGAAVMILDPAALERMPEALRRWAAGGGKAFTVSPLPTLRARTLGPRDSWSVPLAGLPSGAPRAETERVRVLKTPSPGRVFRFRLELERSGLAMVAENDFRNWRAVLDGREVPVRAAGPDLAAVFVPAGRHKLELWWVTTPLEVACSATSGVAWAGVALFGIARVPWRRRLRSLLRRKIASP